MKLITLNTWGKCGPYQERWEYFLKQLELIRPNVLCLQEVGDDELTRKIKTKFNFPYAHAAYDAGLLILSEYFLIQPEVIHYPTQSQLEHCDRKALLVQIQIKQKSICIANTHLSWKEEDQQTRLNQVKELLLKVKTHPNPTILTGDFNDLPESPAGKELRACHFTNLAQALNPKAKIITWDNQNHFIQTHQVHFPDRQIDYIWIPETASNILEPKTCEVVFCTKNKNGIYPSDHYGLMAEFKLKT